MTLIESIPHVLSTAYLWSTMGVVTALSMFVSPILYNGDYKAASKTIGVLLGYGFFASLILFFHTTELNHAPSTDPSAWFQIAFIFLLVAMAYSAGLMLGVAIHNSAHRGIKH